MTPGIVSRQHPRPTRVPAARRRRTAPGRSRGVVLRELRRLRSLPVGAGAEPWGTTFLPAPRREQSGRGNLVPTRRRTDPRAPLRVENGRPYRERIIVIRRPGGEPALHLRAGLGDQI